MGWAIMRDSDGLCLRYGRVQRPEGLGPVQAGETAVPWDGEAMEMVPEPRRYEVSEDALRALYSATLKAELEAARATLEAETGALPVAEVERP